MPPRKVSRHPHSQDSAVWSSQRCRCAWSSCVYTLGLSCEGPTLPLPPPTGVQKLRRAGGKLPGDAQPLHTGPPAARKPCCHLKRHRQASDEALGAWSSTLLAESLLPHPCSRPGVPCFVPCFLCLLELVTPCISRHRGCSSVCPAY